MNFLDHIIKIAVFLVVLAPTSLGAQNNHEYLGDQKINKRLKSFRWTILPAETPLSLGYDRPNRYTPTIEHIMIADSILLADFHQIPMSFSSQKDSSRQYEELHRWLKRSPRQYYGYSDSSKKVLVVNLLITRPSFIPLIFLAPDWKTNHFEILNEGFVFLENVSIKIDLNKGEIVLPHLKRN